MRIAICDDNRAFMEKLMRCIDVPEAEIYTYTSGEELLNADVVFDIVFLDIQLPGADGLAIADQLTKTNKKLLLLFVSSFHQYTTRGYEYRAFRFILKTEPESFMKRYVEEAVAEYRKKNACFFIKEDEKTKKLLYKDVAYIEANKHCIYCCTENEKLLYKGNIGKLENELREHGFFRCHRCYLVNMHYVAHIEKQAFVVMKTGQKIPIGRHYFKTFFSEYKAWEE